MADPVNEDSKPIHEKHKTYRKRAEKCASCEELRAEPDEKIGYPVEKFMFLDVPATLINPPKSTLGREEKLQRNNERENFSIELKLCVSALRNSFGGAVLVHLCGLENEDTYLDYFHELVDIKLHDMIEDDSLFVQTYQKNWLGSLPESKTEFVIIIVDPSFWVVTADFNTKLPLDNCVIDAKANTIFGILTTNPCFEDTTATLRGIVTFVESRSLQVKGFPKEFVTFLNDVSALTKNIWFDLRLRYYVSSFSKVDGGGSFYLGVSEVDSEYTEYKSKKYCVKGFKLPACKHDQFKQQLKSLANEEIRVEMFSSNDPKPEIDDLIKIKFYKKDEGYVLEVAVAAVNGIVFYEKRGPDAYEIDDNDQIHLLDYKEWYERFTNDHQEI